ncbi:unnamed protein product, partial [Notodromas monacha]
TRTVAVRLDNQVAQEYERLAQLKGDKLGTYLRDLLTSNLQMASIERQALWLNYIELFAGCGGLSLGLEASGHNLVIANELSPMAAETFAYNFFNESLDEQHLEHTLWINSNFSKNEVSKRLRENPKTYPPIMNSGFSDLDPSTQLNKKLLVGSIVELNKLLQQQPELLKQIQDEHLEGGLDLVSGGPPCQSFSLAGLRQLGNERNTLPWEFAKFVELTHPKFVLLENVSGILRAFNTDAGQFYAWYEVAKAFSKINYVPLCLHVNAKYAGVAQNRPRFILLGIRVDIYAEIIQKLNEKEQEILKHSYQFLEKLHQTKKQTQKALVANQPAPAALSIPDDACHYCDLRTLTVREMARVQSFPDNFKFLSKVTTGGQMRKFEVPQYTQVGNAVPPLLGVALGLVKLLIDELKEMESMVLNSLKLEAGLLAGTTGGALAGFGAYSSVGLLASASTGTAISGLSGVAATNATLAWLGGGSLASGGFGMAGGMIALGGIVAGPALAIGGF